MYITVANFFLEIVEIQGGQELESRLKNCSKGHILLGEEAEQQKAFYFIKLYPEDGGDNCFGIGIISEGHGLKPHLLVNHLDKSVFIGFNKEVIVFDCVNKVILHRHEMDSLFFSFLSLTQQDCVLIVHELGIIRTTMNGNRVWEYTCDIIHGLNIENDLVKVSFEDERIECIALQDGKRLKENL